jgi:parallel beta-helix repeat protein
MSAHKHHADSMLREEYDVFTSRIRPGQDITTALNAGGLVLLGPGEYTISDDVVIQAPTMLTVQGAGKRRTIINCTAGITISTNDVADYADHGGITLCTSFENLTLFGPSSRDIDCITISWATRLRFADVEFRRWRQAINAVRWWDSQLTCCNFLTCGTLSYPVISLDELPNELYEDTFNNSNNIVLTGCDFERNLGTCIKFFTGTTGCRLNSNRFHGDLPTPVAAPHLLFHTGSYSNTVNGNAFVDCGAACIELDDSDGNMIVANRFNSSEVGINFLNGSRDNVIVANTFGIGPGSVVDEVTGTTTNNELAYNPGYTP